MYAHDLLYLTAVLTHQVWSSYLSKHCAKYLSYGKPNSMYNNNIIMVRLNHTDLARQ